MGDSLNDLLAQRPSDPQTTGAYILVLILCAALMGLVQLFDRQNEKGLVAPMVWTGGWLLSLIILGVSRPGNWVLPAVWLLFLAFALFVYHQRRQSEPPDPNLPARYWLYASGSLAALLGLASSDAGGASPMVQWFVEVFGLDPSAAETLTIAFRKTVHFSYFGLIAGLAWAGMIRLTADVRRSIVFALLWTVCFAAFDELRQLQFPSRSGSFPDFVLDLAGATTFLLLARRGYLRN
ncbi:MAG TPA: VanZ family protein, partial [Fimbriimonadaceae bacterium]|nr:VanZ family protein [Fimbriimonadaceae bacterium]